MYRVRVRIIRVRARVVNRLNCNRIVTEVVRLACFRRLSWRRISRRSRGSVVLDTSWHIAILDYNVLTDTLLWQLGLQRGSLVTIEQFHEALLRWQRRLLGRRISVCEQRELADFVMALRADLHPTGGLEVIDHG